MSETTSQELEEQIRRMTPVAAPADQHEAVVALFRLLDRLARRRGRGAPECRIVGPGGESIGIPESVFFALERVAELLGRGDAVSVVSVGKQLTTQQAADILKVSRQYLVHLLEDGRIPHTRTGTHRRILVEDLVAFKKVRDRERRDSLDKLTRLSEELGGYAELG